MDLLDRIREEVGDTAQAGRLGLLKPSGWQAPSLLLAGMFSSRRGTERKALMSALQTLGFGYGADL